MPLPTPKPSEEETAFIQRCVPLVLESEDLDADSEDDREQAVAICYSQWREDQKEKQMYTCECVECGHTMQSDQHCAELTCPKCGGQMRRAERPGPGKAISQGKETKTFSGLVTKFDDDQGIVEAYWAVMGNVDGGNDIIHPGAFKKTFQERGNQIVVLDNHRTDSINAAIAEPPLLLREAGREELPAELLKSAPDATGGAFGRFQMLMDTPEGKGAYIRLKRRAISKWSFGYDAVQSDYGTVEREGKEINVRNLRQIKLYEISPVLFAMNEATHTLSAKGEGEMEDDKAKWTTAYINDLPDGAFLYIAPGGEKDEEGKTTPRNLRYFPYKDASGKVDLPHLRNAIARIPQSNAPGLTDAKKEALQERARRILDKEQGKSFAIEGLSELRQELAEVKNMVSQLLAGRAGPDDAPPPEARPDDAPPTDTSQKLKELYAALAKLQLLEVEGNEDR